MRRAFLTALAEIAERDPRIVLLTGDLGFMALEPFRDRFPDRFYNCGVAEQNMIGVATGLAEAGFIPFAYSIATFASLRRSNSCATARSCIGCRCVSWAWAWASNTARRGRPTTPWRTWA